MKTKTKEFDCVEMKRKGARKVYKATKGMSIEEEVAYWQKRTEEARRWLAAAPVENPKSVAARSPDRATLRP